MNTKRNIRITKTFLQVNGCGPSFADR